MGQATIEGDNQQRNNKLNLPTIGRYLYFIGGCLVTLNGFISIGEQFEVLGSRCTGSSNCIGPALSWSGGNFVADQNSVWRRVFPLDPVALFDKWTGVFLGAIMMLVHLPGFKLSFCTRTWLHVCFFTVFVMLFGAFPYAGNFGVLVGFFQLPLVLISFLMAFIPAYRNEPTTLLVHTNRSPVCGCLVDNALFLTVTKVLSLFCGLFVVACGLVHVFTHNFNWCPWMTWGSADCVGPSLRWNPTNMDFLFEGNNAFGWRQIFTFKIDTFCALWGPIALGYITCLQHVRGHLWTSIYSTWPRVFMWFMFLALFSAFGYAGNLGILCGFLCVVVALFAMLISFGGGANTQTNLEINVPAFVDNRK